MFCKQLKIYGFIVIISLGLITNVNADALDEVAGYTINVGIKSKQLDFDVSEEGSLKTSGSLTEGSFVTQHLSINSPYHFFSENQRWGYYFEYGFGNFEMNVQNSGDLEVDLGTSAKGSYLYFSPVAFYNFGDSIKLKKKDSFMFGIGAGIGYLQADGNIVLTETTNQLVNFDVNGVDLSVFVVMEYLHDEWFFRAQGGGPSLTDAGFDYEIFDFSLVVGYSFYLQSILWANSLTK